MKHSWLALALVAACGDDQGVRTLDDAPPFDAEPGVASVTLLIGRVPIADRTVYFQGPDGAEIATVQTDASGRASAVVPPGSSITVLDVLRVRFNRPGRNVVTVMGVEPGDELTLRGDAGLVSSNLTFSYPAFGTPPPLYGVITNCNNNEAGMQLSSTLPVPRCGERVDAILLVTDGLGGVEHYIAKPDQPFGDIDVTGETWTPTPTLETTYTNVPDVAGVSSGRFFTSPRGPLYTCRTPLVGTGPTRTSQISCPSFPEAIMLDLMAYQEDRTLYEVAHLITSDAPTIDVANTRLRAPIRNLELDIATRALTWEESATGITPEFVRAHIESDDIDWHVLAPYTESRLVLPRLIGEGAAHDLAPEDLLFPVLTVGTATGGYDAIRRFGPNYLDGITTEIAQLVVAELSAGE